MILSVYTTSWRSSIVIFMDLVVKCCAFILRYWTHGELPIDGFTCRVEKPVPLGDWSVQTMWQSSFDWLCASHVSMVTPIHPDRRPEETCSSTLKKCWDQNIVCWGAVKGWEGLKVANGSWADRHGWFRDVQKPDMYQCDTNKCVFLIYRCFFFKMYDVIHVHHIILTKAYIIHIALLSHFTSDKNNHWSQPLYFKNPQTRTRQRYVTRMTSARANWKSKSVPKYWSHSAMHCGMFLDVTFSSWILQIFLDIFVRFCKVSYIYIYIWIHSIVCIRQLHVYLHMHILSSCLMCCCVVLYVLLKLGVWLMVATVSTRKL